MWINYKNKDSNLNHRDSCLGITFGKKQNLKLLTISTIPINKIYIFYINKGKLNVDNSSTCYLTQAITVLQKWKLCSVVVCQSKNKR